MDHQELETQLNAYIEGRLHPRQVSQVEQALQAHPELAAQVEASRRVHQELTSTFAGIALHADVANEVMDHVAPSMLRLSSQRWPYFIPAAIAAALLISLSGLFLWKAYSPPAEQMVATLESEFELSFVEAIRVVSVHQAGTASATALITAIDTGEQILCRSGDAYRDHRLQTIRSNSVVFDDSSGQPMELAVSPLTQADHNKIDAYVAILAQYVKQSNDALDTRAFNQLLSLSRMGNSSAIHVLRQISENKNNALHTHAAQALSQEQNARHLAYVAQKVLDPDIQARRQLLQALAHENSPIVMASLRQIAGNGSDPDQFLAMQWLAYHGDLASLPLMQRAGDQLHSQGNTQQAQQVRSFIDTITSPNALSTAH